MEYLSEKSRNLLKFYLNLYGYTAKDISAIIGKTYSMTVRRLCGRLRFRDEEVKKIKDALNMPSGDVMRIFYPDLALTAGESRTVNILKDIDDYVHSRYGLEIVISSKLEIDTFKELLRRFLMAWMDNPRKTVFKFELSEIEKQTGNKMFSIHEILVQKQTASGVIHYRLFRRVELTKEFIILEVDGGQLCRELKKHRKN